MNHISKTLRLAFRFTSLQSRIFAANSRCLCAARRVLCSDAIISHNSASVAPLTTYVQKRFLKKKERTNLPSADEDEEKSEREELEVVKDYKDLNILVPNPRVDNVLRKAAGLARNKIEAVFYESKIYMNEKKLRKKSEELHEDDVVDLILGVNNDNRDLLDVLRIIVLDISDIPNDDDKYEVRVRKFSRLIVENYEEPWKPST
ncbi:uncharacterized protein B4U80_06967 [Leptotrombidium deliense]|uniref:Mitochondrial transcription rescue factor 1 C-terminal domain-containing protein n=1 Tax=Leptotrombidium deliense TaxID=299467 RepID=A0A443SKU0_9ACAR|nr:uncharacterized protein B4U80_06967 [Leptotrombidium deliense]